MVAGYRLSPEVPKTNKRAMGITTAMQCNADCLASFSREEGGSTNYLTEKKVKTTEAPFHITEMWQSNKVQCVAYEILFMDLTWFSQTCP